MHIVKKRNILGKLGSKLVYSALLLHYTLFDVHGSWRNKLLIVGALCYLVFPIDLIPDFIPVAGFTDDLGALLFVVRKVAFNITPRIREKANRKLKKLTGED